MADGDKVHNGLARRWQSAYMQICEWGLGEDAIEESVADRLLKDLKWFGQGPIDFLHCLAAMLEPWAVASRKLTAADAMDLRNQAQIQAATATGRPAAIELARRSFEQQLIDIKRGECPKSALELRRELIRKYGINIYLTNFEQSAPLNPQDHYNGVNQAIVSARLRIIRPAIDREVRFFGRQLAANKMVVKDIRRISRQRNHNIDESFRVPVPAA